MTTPSGQGEHAEQQAVAYAWASRSFSCGLWVDPPGRIWECYVHDTDELAMVLVGEVEFEIGRQVHRPRPGQELFFPARVIHTVRNV